MTSIRSFVPLQKLGQGTYSNVYKVRRIDDNQIYALKKVKLTSLNQKQKQNALNEVRILASIQSSNIIAYKQAFFDESLSVLCVVMQYADDGDLQKYIKNHVKSLRLIQQQQIWKAAENILKGLQNLHSRGILHRDIKCANIFKSKGIYKLGDLNVSKVNGDKLAYTQTGTPYYASPQVWRDQPYDNKSDIWSFGCIIYQMAALKPPFNGKDMEDLFKNIQKGKLVPLTAHYSTQLWKFIQTCLQKDPKKRPSAKQLLKNLKKHHQNALSGLKIQNPQSNKLLKTIKLPTDLKKLNQALPTSKYRKQQSIKNPTQETVSLSSKNILKENSKNNHLKEQNQNFKKQFRIQNKNQVPKQISNYDLENQKIDYQTQKCNSKNSKLINKSDILLSNIQQNNIKTDIQHSYISNSYKSPKNKSQFHNLLKSPVSQIRLSKKVQSCLGYSQRLQRSDKKPSTASKVEKIKKYQDFEVSIKNITQQLRKPVSIPRTQKKANIINNSHLIERSPVNIDSERVKNIHPSQNLSQVAAMKYNSNHVHQKKVILDQKYEALDVWRNKLLKKNRILSSNHPKPSWW